MTCTAEGGPSLTQTSTKTVKLSSGTGGGGEPNNFLGSERCGGMWDNGLWNDNYCEGSNKVICSDVQGQNVSFIFINQSMTWTKAQSFCREHHTDLPSVRTSTENEQIKGLMQSLDVVQVWIGLYRLSWTWVDGSHFNFYYWKTSQPNGSEENCAAAALEEGGKWEDWHCSFKMPFFCYDVPVSKQVVKVKLVKTSSVDLNDPAVLEDLLKQFEQKLKDNSVDGDIKLSWRDQ
ncbi:hypothetical protein XENOCAPTIV_014456 [Xenoophorus captivus]|uniref:C-type lectin domain-containing protein n=1 Tax=Xenoophorus captivus TaxID=1517983 RepID=A0ABV0RQS2_9TELE